MRRLTRRARVSWFCNVKSASLNFSVPSIFEKSGSKIFNQEKGIINLPISYFSNTVIYISNYYYLFPVFSFFF